MPVKSGVDQVLDRLFKTLTAQQAVQTPEPEQLEKRATGIPKSPMPPIPAARMAEPLPAIQPRRISNPLFKGKPLPPRPQDLGYGGKKEEPPPPSLEPPLEEFIRQFYIENNAPEVLLKHRGALLPSEEAEMMRIESLWLERARQEYDKRWGKGATLKAVARQLPTKVLGMPAISAILEPTKSPTVMEWVETAINLGLMAAPYVPKGVTAVRGAGRAAAPVVKEFAAGERGSIGKVPKKAPSEVVEIEPGRRWEIIVQGEQAGEVIDNYGKITVFGGGKHWEMPTRADAFAKLRELAIEHEKGIKRRPPTPQAKVGVPEPFKMPEKPPLVAQPSQEWQRLSTTSRIKLIQSIPAEERASVGLTPGDANTAWGSLSQGKRKLILSKRIPEPFKLPEEAIPEKVTPAEVPVAPKVMRPTHKQAVANAQRVAKEREAKVFRETEAKFAEEAASTETITEREIRRAAVVKGAVEPSVRKVEVPVKPIVPKVEPVISPSEPPVPPAAQPTGVVPPAKDNLAVIENMWKQKPQKQSPERLLKTMEYINDRNFGIRRMQTRVAKVLPIEPGVDRDVITAITRTPGMANAGLARATITLKNVERIYPKVADNAVDDIVHINHGKEVLLSKGAKRVMAGGFKDTRDYDNALNQLRAKLGDAEYAKAEKAANVIKDVYTSERDRLLQTGFISKEASDLMAAQYPWYNPLRYVDDMVELEAKGKSIKPLDVITSPVKRLTEKGTAKPAVLPRLVLVQQLVKNEVAIGKNDLTKAIVKLGLEDPKTAPLIKKTVRIRPVAQVEGEPVFRPVRQVEENIVHFYENGKLQSYEVPDWMYREMVVLQKTISNPVSSIIGTMNGISRAAFTTFSPAFVVSNMLNDSITTFITRGILPYNSVRGMVHAARGLKNDKILQSFQLGGGYQMRFFGKDAAQVLKEVNSTGGSIVKGNSSILKKIVNAIPKAGEIGEQGPRIGLFERELNKTLPAWKTMTAEQIAAHPLARKAIADSIELSINFARGGYLNKAANPYIIFLNANMEAMKLPYRALASNPNARWRLAAVAAGGLGIATYNLSYPEYMDIPDYIRWGSFVVMLPSKEKNADGTSKPNYLTIIPRTREWGLFLGPLTYGMEKLYAEAPVEFGRFTSVMTPMLMPFNEFPGPALLQETAGQFANWDFYRSQPIVSGRLENLPLEEQVQPWTSRTMKELVQGVGLSPVRVEQFYNGIFGGAGRAVTSMSDWIINQLKPEEPSQDILDLAGRYEALLTEKQKEAFMNRLSASTKNELRNYLEKRPGGIPVISPIIQRVVPGRGGQLERNVEKQKRRVAFLPKYVEDVLTLEQIESLDIDFLKKQKETDTKLIEQYNLITDEDAKWQLVLRNKYLRVHPEVDVALNVWGHLETVKTTEAKEMLQERARELGIPEDTLPALSKPVRVTATGRRATLPSVKPKTRIMPVKPKVTKPKTTRPTGGIKVLKKSTYAKSKRNQVVPRQFKPFAK